MHGRYHIWYVWYGAIFDILALAARRIGTAASNHALLACVLKYAEMIQKSGEKKPSHLEFHEPTILFGGKQGEGTTVVSDQIIHTDFRTTDDHYSVSTNPRLTGFGIPGSIMIPLSAKGRHVFMAGQHVTIQFGHAIVFQGDCPHAGSTIPSSQFDDHDCRPSLHAYVSWLAHEFDRFG